MPLAARAGLGILLLAGLAAAQAAGAAADMPAPRGTTLSLVAGTGPSSPTQSVSFRWLGWAALHYSTPMNFLGQGDGPLAGHWEYTEELFALSVTRDGTALAAGWSPIGFRYAMLGHNRLRPYVQGGAGMLFATRRIPDGASRFNFTPQGAVGANFGPSLHKVWSFEVRYAHISNAGIYYPRPNPGINSILFLGGYTF